MGGAVLPVGGANAGGVWAGWVGQGEDGAGLRGGAGAGLRGGAGRGLW